jgi:phosphoenolpyruvate carboxykinase (ATP)
VRHPAVYARLLADKLARHGAQAWLVNTGWTGGAYGTGRRIDLGVTRRIIDGIHAGTLATAPVARDPVFGLEAVTAVPGVDRGALVPAESWGNASAWDEAARKLAGRFRENFQTYAAEAGRDILEAGPVVP